MACILASGLIIGPLINFLGQTGPRQLGVSEFASVNQASTSTGWSLHPPRSDEALQLQIYLTSIPVPASLNSPDKVIWHIANRESSLFSSHCTWEELRQHDHLQSWTSNVWFKGATPRQAFNFWIALIDSQLEQDLLDGD